MDNGNAYDSLTYVNEHKEMTLKPICLNVVEFLEILLSNELQQRRINEKYETPQVGSGKGVSSHSVPLMTRPSRKKIGH